MVYPPLVSHYILPNALAGSYKPLPLSADQLTSRGSLKDLDLAIEFRVAPAKTKESSPPPFFVVLSTLISLRLFEIRIRSASYMIALIIARH